MATSDHPVFSSLFLGPSTTVPEKTNGSPSSPAVDTSDRDYSSVQTSPDLSPRIGAFGPGMFSGLLQPNATTGSVSGESPSSSLSGTMTINGLQFNISSSAPSRMLCVKNIPRLVPDAEISRLFTDCGQIRSLFSGSKSKGLVVVSFYDLRDAIHAKNTFNGHVMHQQRLELQYTIPKDGLPETEMNQGTLVIFNLTPNTTNEDIVTMFGRYGEIREVRESPHKKHHKFVEFYDIRCADRALLALNRSEVNGKRIKIEHSRPGLRKASVDAMTPDFNDSPFEAPAAQPPPFTLVNGSGYGGARLDQSGQKPVAPRASTDLRSIAARHTKLPEFVPASYQGGTFSSPSTASPPLPYNEGPPSPDPWSSSDQHAFGYSTQSEWPRQSLSSPRAGYYESSAYDGHQSPSFGPVAASFGVESDGMYGMYQNPSGTRYPPRGPRRTTAEHVEYFPMMHDLEENLPDGSYHSHYGRPMSTSAPPSFRPYPTTNAPSPLLSRSSPAAVPDPMHQQQNHVEYMKIIPHGRTFAGDGAGQPPRQARGGRRQSSSNAAMALDLNRVISGEDKRTTLMVRNIPNKYSQKMLLQAVDVDFRGLYDFFYLPIDFKNKCNMGYAFINFMEPGNIIGFAQRFRCKKWDRFNSEKICELSYARIQGKTNLIQHFSNSSLLSEDKKCRPLLFVSEGANKGDPEPFPMPTQATPSRTRRGVSDVSN